MPSLTAPAAAAAGDVAKSHDYPGIGRFKGSIITGYDVKDFERNAAGRSIQGRQGH